MKKNKSYVIIMAILFIFLIVMGLVFSLNNNKNEEEDYGMVIIVGDDTIWTYDNNKWGKGSYYEDFNNKKYYIYINNENSGNYYLSYTGKWEVIDENNENILLDGELLALRSNDTIPVYNFSTTKIDDYSYVYSVLNDNNLPTISQYTVNKKIVFDFDNDGEDESFYIISNVFPMGFTPDNVFSIVFMVKNGEIYPIYKDINKYSGFNGCKPYISSFLDVDNDSKSEIILSCAEYSVSGVKRMLYKYDNDEFKILISNNK